MKDELAQRIYEAAPKLYHQEGPEDIEGMSLNTIARKCDPVYLGVGDGWFQILMDLSVKLEAMGGNIDILQVKQKFGTLRFYVRSANATAWLAIEAAEELSETTCEVCGESGELQNDGWLNTICDKHKEEK